MKTFIGILLIGLLGFLGCSGSDDGTRTFTGETTPLAPYGIVDTGVPTFTWIKAPGATSYCLLVKNDLEETIIQDCYTLEEGKSYGPPDEVDEIFSVAPAVEVSDATWAV